VYRKTGLGFRKRGDACKPGSTARSFSGTSVYYSYSLCRRGTSISLARLSVTPPKCSSHTAEDLVPEERHQVYIPLRLNVYSRLDRPLEIKDIYASLVREPRR